MPGQAPTPRRILEARGSWRAKLAADEPADKVQVPTCPDWLDAEGRAEWKRLSPLLRKRGTVHRISRGVLAGLCQVWSQFVKASRELNRLLHDANADPLLIRRWSAISRESFTNYLRAAGEFGLTPASKTRVQVTGNHNASGDEKAKYFRAG